MRKETYDLLELHEKNIISVSLQKIPISELVFDENYSKEKNIAMNRAFIRWDIGEYHMLPHDITGFALPCDYPELDFVCLDEAINAGVICMSNDFINEKIKIRTIPRELKMWLENLWDEDL